MMENLPRQIFEYNNIEFKLTALFQYGLMCYCQELMDAFISALDAAVQDEFDVAAQVSDEEWEAIRPNKLQRRDMLLKQMQVFRALFIFLTVAYNFSIPWRFHFRS